MAALLKKRAVAEFSQVIQEEPKPIKRLKLIQRPPPPEISLDLEGATSTYDTLQRLLAFEGNFPLRGEDVSGVVRELLDHYPREKEAVLRWKISSLLARLVQLPGFNAEALTDDIIRLLKTEKSNKAISQLVEVLRKIGMCSPYNTSLHHQLISTSKQYLRNTGHIARCSCLDLIGDLGSPDQTVEDSSQSGRRSLTIQKLLMGFTQDHDPRVRSRAFQAMLQFHQRGLPLGEGIYQQACSALTDDYRGVRLAAIKLVWVLSHLYPDSLIAVPDSDEKLRLVDDGFTKICNMINDISMIVRVEAATLLGSLHQVSPKFLEQTLDKKLMSNMRKKESAHERAKEHFSSGQWATGQKFADDAPKEHVDPDAVSLMNIGACGAFVHGLEDEFLEVRNASLDSLCELAVQSPSFAALSQDSIIDMFNDEIKSVRLNAINSLRKLSHLLTLREDQLEIILGVLQLMKQQQTLPGNSSVANDTIISTTDKILSMTKQLQHVYLGLGITELSLVRQTEVKARTLQTLSRLGDYQELTNVRDRFNRQLRTLHKYMTSHQITPDPFSTYLFSVLDNLDSCSDTEFRKHLQFSLKSVKACAFPVVNKIRKASVVLHEPTGTSDNPIKFAAGLTSAVAVEATLENIQSPCHVKLQVKYADQQTQLITLSPDAFQRLGQLRHRLQSQVLLSHSPWSDSTHVEISVVMDVPSLSGDHGNKESVIQLCNPVKVLVSPKTFKR
ncbi:integrator complex subunit 4-like [Mizuhopecten yessoensis]|uniref:integrator complex subunit 4-like n=1 Tax=Mizuhopecten yessoensis TaxID=6573 RepID=UPI000B45BCF0|nr:integrator complex subunit 4-like [Mizuhopecten yessoensis]